MYIQPSWIDAASDHNQWSGGNGQYRGDKSADIATFDKQGRARVGAFSDEALEARKPKKKSSLTIQQKILPQASRVERLTEQLKELVQEYQKGNIDIDEYSLLLSVVSAKRDRALFLLNKAKSVRAPFEIEEEEAISLGKTRVKSEKSFKTSKRIATEGNRFKDAKKAAIRDSNFLSKALTFLAKNDFCYMAVCSSILFSILKVIL
jgi:hypothetical protein